MKPLVSILIPTYNQVDLVEETVRSALDQDYENLQVVVADDASSDGTQDVLAKLAAENPDRLVVIAGSENLGITGNCNRGLDRCDGSYVAMQGGDDVLMPEKVSRQIEWFENNADGVLCYHDCEVFESGTGNTICNYSALGGFSEGYGPGRIIRNMRLSAATSVMVKRSEIPESGFDRRLPMVSDWKLQIDVLAGGGKYGYVDGILARYRRHGDNSRKAFPARYYQDCLFTLAIVETEMIGYAKEARLARARVNGLMSIDQLNRGNRRAGLSLAAASLRIGVFSWKFPVAVVYLVLPKSVREFVRRTLLSKSRALNYLDA